MTPLLPHPVEPPRGVYGHVATIFNPDPNVDGHWSWLLSYIGEGFVEEALGPLGHILEIVRSRGCRSVVIEHRYTDADYRSEYSAFWSERFEDRPAHAARLHFFEAILSPEQLCDLPGCEYLGYSVLRPTELGPVGRTVVVPPEALANARLTYIVEKPSLFGNPLRVAGVPFCQQDGELLRCAHAAAWICHYVAFHRGIIGRRLTAEIAQMPSVEGSKHRPLPATGLTGEQLQTVFSAIGIPAFFYEISNLPRLPAPLALPELKGRNRFGKKRQTIEADHARRVADERIFRVVCKYLNSGFPVVVLTDAPGANHAFTLVGWEHTPNGVRLIACDDQRGPYEVIDSPTQDGEERGAWKALMIPLPRKVYLTGEAAESRARQMVIAEHDQAAAENDPAASEFSDVARALAQLNGPVSVRARLVEGRRYKAIAGAQERDPAAVRVVRMTHLPHWVWLVEFQDRASRDAQQPSVLAEIVFDSTSHDEAPIVDLLATRSVAIDVSAAEPPDEQEADDPLWLAQTGGNMWRSLISDPTVLDDEYAELGAGAAAVTEDVAVQQEPDE